MTSEEARALLPAKRAAASQAWQAYKAAAEAFRRAKDDLNTCTLIADGRFDDAAVEQFGVSYYGVVRKVEPTPARCHAVSSKGPWSWAV